MGTLERGKVAKDIEDAVFALKKDELTAEPIKIGNHLTLIQVTDIQPPSRQKLEDVKVEVATALLKERAGDSIAKAEADALFAKLVKGEALDKLTKGEGEDKAPPKPEKEAVKPVKGAKGKGKAAKVAKAEPPPPANLPVRSDTAWVLKSQGAIPRIGASKELFADVFSLTTEHPLAKQVYKVGKAYFVVTLKDRETPDLAKFDGEKDSLRQQALWAKRTRVYREWLTHLKATARIQYSPALVAPEKEAKG